ncbi:EutN/CcmL family microcompartment protein [Silvimonas iriomotensis]|uniref:Ethanolamine utilization protein EutN n=1 Tax=Silvimonas iriomotensis TaxID=449662 RepID=A0ABQ2PAQ3_9NEIS|nr:EutN/CcmL family microcompartment protein [Silvimonas iriomotensis]GGP22522.1 ethanolamine utilization protein EutN [Silvimonas iriomotensis]
MKLGIVVGQVVATVKHGNLRLDRLLLVDLVGLDGVARGDMQVAADCLGAGTGEWVLLVSGSSARGLQDESAPVDLSVAGIVDEVVIGGKVAYHK